jgi:thermitase
MLKPTVTAVVVVALGMAVAPVASSRPQPRAARLGLDAFRPETVPGELIVGYKRGASSVSRRGVVSSLGARTARSWGRTALVRLDRGVSITDTIAELESDPAVAYAEPNLFRYPLVPPPNDPSFTDQWGLLNTGQPHGVAGSSVTTSGTAGADMKVTQAWDTTRGDDETVIAILDSGVDVTHPDLAANIWTNPDEIPGNNQDDDGNGYVDDVNGYDFAEKDLSLIEPNTSIFGFDHGTHVAGTAAAVADNGVGIAGVCPGCKIMVLKVFDAFDTDGRNGPDTMLGDVADGIAAIDYAIREGADVINGSLGAPLLWSNGERNVLKRALSAGISPVFAAGNERGDNDLALILDFGGPEGPDVLSPSYPASYNLPGLISVAASNDLDRNGYSTRCGQVMGVQHWECSFTNFGRESVDLSAPGVDIVSTVPGGYDTFDGTSMASPHVAGAVGLLRTARPGLTPVQIRNALLHSAEGSLGFRTLNSFKGQTATGQFTVTGGRVDAFAALTAPTTNFQTRTDGNIVGARSIKRSRRDTVVWPSDTNDVYRKRLIRGNRYKIVLNGPAGKDFDLVVYKPGVKEIWQLQMGCFTFVGSCKLVRPHRPVDLDADEGVTFTAKRTGRHFFHVAAFPFQKGAYTLIVKRI